MVDLVNIFNIGDDTTEGIIKATLDRMFTGERFTSPEDYKDLQGDIGGLLRVKQKNVDVLSDRIKHARGGSPNF